MKSARAIRARMIETLSQIVRRPTLWGHDGRAVEFLLLGTLYDLCFIDERDDAFEASRDDLRSRRQFSSLGVNGSFENWVSQAGCFRSEVASVYAGVALRLGYLTIAPRMPRAEFRRLKRGLRAAIRGRDWTSEEVASEFGPPTLRCGEVECFLADDDPHGWICFDYLPLGRDELLGHPRKLRNIRAPAAQFPRELTFTPAGRLMRHDPRAGARHLVGVQAG